MIILFILIGVVSQKYFYELSFFQLHTENVIIVSRNTGGQFYSDILFAMSLGIIPLLYLIAKKMAKLNSLPQKIIAWSLIIGFGILVWQSRIWYLNYHFNKLTGFVMKEGMKITVSLQWLKVQMYLLGGFVAGMLATILIFKFKN